jgi:hypothetical protein
MSQRLSKAQATTLTTKIMTACDVDERVLEYWEKMMQQLVTGTPEEQKRTVDKVFGRELHDMHRSFQVMRMYASELQEYVRNG